MQKSCIGTHIAYYIIVVNRNSLKFDLTTSTAADTGFSGLFFLIAAVFSFKKARIMRA